MGFGEVVVEGAVRRCETTHFGAIQTRGNVTAVKVKQNTTNDAAVGTCVANTVKRFRFNPGPEGGSVTYAYPFVFAPQG